MICADTANKAQDIAKEMGWTYHEDENIWPNKFSINAPDTDMSLTMNRDNGRLWIYGLHPLFTKHSEKITVAWDTPIPKIVSAINKRLFPKLFPKIEKRKDEEQTKKYCQETLEATIKKFEAMDFKYYQWNSHLCKKIGDIDFTVTIYEPYEFGDPCRIFAETKTQSEDFDEENSLVFKMLALLTSKENTNETP